MALAIDRPFLDQPFMETAIGHATLEIFASSPCAKVAACDRISEIAKGVIFLALTAAGRAGLYPLSVKLFPDNPIAGNALAMTFVTGWGALAYKSYWNLDRSRVAFLKLSDGQQGGSVLAEVAKVATSIVAGFLAEFPFIFVAYRDNDYNPIYWVTGAGNIIIPSYSFYESINAIQSRMRYSEGEIATKKRQNLALDSLKRCIENIPYLSSEKVAELTAWTDILSDTEQTAAHATALQELLTCTRRVEFLGEERKGVSTCSSWTTMSVATILSFSQLFWIGYLSYQGWGSITASDAAASFFAIVSVLINLYYSQELMLHNFEALRRLVYCQRKKTLAEKHYPALTFGCKGVFTAISLLAFGTPTYMSLALPAPWRYISAVLFCAQNQIAPIVPITREIDGLISRAVAVRSSDAATRKVFDLYNKMQKLHFLLEHASPKAFASMESFCEDLV